MRGCAGGRKNRRRLTRAVLRLALLLPVSVAPALCGTAVAVSDQDRDIPDVAVIVAGGTGRTTALRTGEPTFARLWQLLQPTYVGTERVPQAWEEGRHPPMRITVIWGLTGVGGWPQTNRPPGGDVAVERQDQLFLADDGTPWVRSDLTPNVEDDDIRWHRAPRAIFDQLDRAGLVGEAGSEGEGAAEGLERGARWAVPGLAVGLAAGVGGTLLMRRAAARREAGAPRDEPRHELIDLDL
jgi:hypothetical protein